MTGLISEQTVLQAVRSGKKVLTLSPRAIVTPAARDAALKHSVQLNTVISTSPGSTSSETNAAGITVFVGSDHGGFELKEQLKPFIASLGYSIEDVGTYSTESVDYPDFAVKVAEKVAMDSASLGIVVDGAGVGSAITANKVAGIRAASCQDVYTARNSRAHNNANVLTLGSRVLGPDIANDIVRVWLSTGFEGGRHQTRVDKILAVERQYQKS